MVDKLKTGAAACGEVIKMDIVDELFVEEWSKMSDVYRLGNEYLRQKFKLWFRKGYEQQPAVEKEK
jgi:hypothetical protein